MLPLMLGQRELFIMFFSPAKGFSNSDFYSLPLSERRNNTDTDIWMGWASPAWLPISVSSSHPYKTSTASKHRTCSTSTWSPNLLQAGVSGAVSLLGWMFFFLSFSSHFFFYVYLQNNLSPLLTWPLEKYFLSTCVWEDFIKVRYLNHLKWIKYP